MNYELLAEGIESLGIEYTPEREKKLKLYLSELTLWNPKLGLVKADDDEIIIKHVLDCLAGIGVLSGLKGDSIADIGSGAGLPGLLLAIFMEDKKFSLVERSGRRCSFLRNAVTLLGLRSRVEVIESPLEQVSDNFDIVVFRAFRAIDDFFPELNRITKSDGVLAAYKGRRSVIDKEIKLISERYGYNGDINIYPLKVPFLNDERNLVTFFSINS